MDPSWTPSRASSRVPEDQPGGRVQPRDGVAGKRRECVMIAPLRPFDEVSLVHDLALATVHGALRIDAPAPRA